MIAVLEAAQEGKTIQGKRHIAANAGEFYTYDNDHRPMWNFDAIEYRVKPEPREYWIRKDQAQFESSTAFSNKLMGFDRRDFIKVTEQL